jgi:hypothetical protein
MPIRESRPRVILSKTWYYTCRPRRRLAARVVSVGKLSRLANNASQAVTRSGSSRLRKPYFRYEDFSPDVLRDKADGAGQSAARGPLRCASRRRRRIFLSGHLPRRRKGAGVAGPVLLQQTTMSVTIISTSLQSSATQCQTHRSREVPRLSMRSIHYPCLTTMKP